MLSVAAYTQGIRVPSARFRVRQHIAPLQPLGVEIREYPARFSSFPPAWKLFGINTCQTKASGS